MQATPLFCRSRFGLLSFSEGCCNAAEYKDILCDCLPPTLWQQLGEETHGGVHKTLDYSVAE